MSVGRRMWIWEGCIVERFDEPWIEDAENDPSSDVNVLQELRMFMEQRNTRRRPRIRITFEDLQ